MPVRRLVRPATGACCAASIGGIGTIERWGEMRPVRKKSRWLVLLGMAIAGAMALPVFLAAQNLHNMVASRTRILPQVGSGVIAMREDSAGRVYVLANPGHNILVFDATGNQVGQIPAAANAGAVNYAIDFDVAVNGNVVVADRGSNQVEVFAPDGSLKSKTTVFAPTSVVALSNGQFAVTTLRTQHPVEVIDQTGRVVRGFGESHQSQQSSDEPAAAPPPLADSGRITGDSADNLYFAAFSDTDPQLRKYDRFGYASYETPVPTPSDIETTVDDRVQVGFNFTRLSRSNQVNAWTTMGESGKVDFGANVGKGLTGLLAERNQPAGQVGGPIVGTLTASTSLARSEFGMHLGPDNGTGGVGGTGGGVGNGGTTSASASGSTAALQFGANGSSQDSAANSPSFNPGLGSTDLRYTVPTTLDYMLGSSQPGANAGVGGFSSYSLAAIGPLAGERYRPFGQRPGFPARGPEGSLASASPTSPSLLSGGSPTTPLQAILAQNPSLAVPSTDAAPGPRGRYNATSLSMVTSLRVNLDKPQAPSPVDKKITAIGVDHKTQEVWIAFHSMLVHFSRDGDVAETFYLTTPQGAALHASAIVVEPDRLLIGSSSGGVYEFARPDKPAGAAAVKPAAQPSPSNP